jgi:hypothetical protein
MIIDRDMSYDLSLRDGTYNSSTRVAVNIHPKQKEPNTSRETREIVTANSETKSKDPK